VDEPRRNDAFDRELRRTLAAGGGAAAGPHLDAELAAAWMDRRLDASTARSIEAHLADCADCQMTMATLARLSPEASATGDGFAWWRRLRAGWLVPASVAAAAALVIWVALPQQRAASTPPDRIQTLDDRASAPDQTRSQPAAPDAPESSTASLSAEAPAAAPPPAAPREADADAGARGFAAPSSEPQRKMADFARVAPPPAAPAAAPAVPAAPELERRDRAEAAAPATVEPLKETITVQGQTPIVDTQTTTRVGEAQGRASARQEAAAPSQDQLRRNAADVAALRAAAALTIVATDGAGRWRRAGSAIEFAPRAGAGFIAVTLPVSAEAMTAGSSPGGTVCWLVGDGGLVLVSVDGVRFIRVSAPAAVNLAAVTATDARTAIVTASTGRRFRTADQGASWTALP
jgi:hypothetical protein